MTSIGLWGSSVVVVVGAVVVLVVVELVLVGGSVVLVVVELELVLVDGSVVLVVVELELVVVELELVVVELELVVVVLVGGGQGFGPFPGVLTPHLSGFDADVAAAEKKEPNSITGPISPIATRLIWNLRQRLDQAVRPKSLSHFEGR